MKLNKKKVIVLALVVCLIAMLSVGTLAWFTDEDSIKNDFYFGDSNTPADEVFGVEVWEDRDTNGDGDYNEADDAEKTEGLTYETILPGEVLSKEPYLENTGIHPQYVRAIVTVTHGDYVRAAMKKGDGETWQDAAKRLFGGISSNWTLETVHYYTDNYYTHALVFVFYYNQVLEAGQTTDKIFTDVIVPTELTKEDAANMDSFSVIVKGEAIQSEHLADPQTPGAMVTTAKRAFELYVDSDTRYAGYARYQLY